MCAESIAPEEEAWDVWNVIVGLGLGVAAYILALGVLKGVLPSE